jgi:hypothetical protein
MMPDQAVNLLCNCVRATCDLTNAVNSSSRGTGTLVKKEQQAYKSVFIALVGRKPTKEELNSITG